MERLRQFGEHVKDAKAAHFKGYEDVQELLNTMAHVLGDNINKQNWYKAVSLAWEGFRAVCVVQSCCLLLVWSADSCRMRQSGRLFLNQISCPLLAL
jgi:hypothetical protein